MLSFTVDAILSSSKTKTTTTKLKDENHEGIEEDAIRIPPFHHPLPPLSIKIPKAPKIRCISKYGTAITDDPYFGRVAVSLENYLLWEMFRKVGTEMVITKSGRRMFPALRFSVSGLHPSKRYAVAIEIFSADNYRYKYHDSEWCITGKAFPETPCKQRMCVHGDSPATGFKWCSNIVSFHKLKITNNTARSNQKQIILNSLQKYQPRLHITEVYSEKDMLADDIDLEGFPSMTFEFPEATFIAVTAYQSEQITQLKIDNNPFAKGFRDPTPAEIERTRLINPSLYNMLMKSKEHSTNIKYHLPKTPSPPLNSIPPTLSCYSKPSITTSPYHPYTRSISNRIDHFPTPRDIEVQRRITRIEKFEKKIYSIPSYSPLGSPPLHNVGRYGRLSCFCCTGPKIWNHFDHVESKRSEMIA
ncbi:T-box transcription factor TBX2-A-like isoform X2 [Clytia hemisphaerica]